MREPESYWLRKGPVIPDLADLPPGSFNGDERAWCSLSPGMRRTVWRDALHRQAIARQLPDDMVARIRSMTISGSLGTLDQYIEQIEQADEARSPLPEDVERLQRADSAHQKSATQIAAREAV